MQSDASVCKHPNIHFEFISANLLADYADDQPEVLAGLIQSGDDRQFNTLFPVLEAHKQKAIDLLKREAAKPGRTKDMAASGSWAP